MKSGRFLLAFDLIVAFCRGMTSRFSIEPWLHQRECSTESHHRLSVLVALDTIVALLIRAFKLRTSNEAQVTVLCWMALQVPGSRTRLRDFELGFTSFCRHFFSMDATTM
jgi:hypothetical protein